MIFNWCPLGNGGSKKRKQITSSSLAWSMVISLSIVNKHDWLHVPLSPHWVNLGKSTFSQDILGDIQGCYPVPGHQPGYCGQKMWPVTQGPTLNVIRVVMKPLPKSWLSSSAADFSAHCHHRNSYTRPLRRARPSWFAPSPDAGPFLPSWSLSRARFQD